MDNLLRKIETEEVVVYTDQIYSIDVLNKCRKIHEALVAEGKLEGEFSADKWMGYSGVKRFGIDFSMDEALYNAHIGKEFGIGIEKMKNMLRCYAIYCNGVYIYQTIARDKIQVIKDFLQHFKDKDFKLNTTGITTVEDFLGFIIGLIENREQLYGIDAELLDMVKARGDGSAVFFIERSLFNETQIFFGIGFAAAPCFGGSEVGHMHFIDGELLAVLIGRLHFVPAGRVGF